MTEYFTPESFILRCFTVDSDKVMCWYLSGTSIEFSLLLLLWLLSFHVNSEDALRTIPNSKFKYFWLVILQLMVFCHLLTRVVEKCTNLVQRIMKLIIPVELYPVLCLGVKSLCSVCRSTQPLSVSWKPGRHLVTRFSWLNYLINSSFLWR